MQTVSCNSMHRLASPARMWDIFCEVIDNYGDIGVCWRLAVNLAQRGQRVRLWASDTAPLQWLAPHGHAGVEVLPWHTPLAEVDLPSEPADVLIEAFGCTLDPVVQARWAQQQATHPGVWLNLEYLSAEPYVQRCHLLPSPVLSGPAAGCGKFFFYPGFVGQTGGLLREPDLLQRQQRFDRAAWLAQWQVPAQAQAISLFCYEPPVLRQLLQQLQQAAQTHASHDHATGMAGQLHVFITQGRSRQAALAALPAEVAHALAVQGQAQWGRLVLHALPWLEHAVFDELLWACDFNLVRGEDSLVRALWAGKPFVWQIYPQDDAAHHAKLLAFLDWMQAPSAWRTWHMAWNGLTPAPLPLLTTQDLAVWQDCVRSARQRLLQQPDLACQLLNFVDGQLAGKACM